MKTIQEKIKNILEDFKIQRSELRQCLEIAYEKTSRMPEYISIGKHKPSRQAMDKIWNSYGIPHQIFLDLDNYLEEEGETSSTEASA